MKANLLALNGTASRANVTTLMDFAKTLLLTATTTANVQSIAVILPMVNVLTLLSTVTMVTPVPLTLAIH